MTGSRLGDRLNRIGGDEEVCTDESERILLHESRKVEISSVDTFVGLDGRLRIHREKRCRLLVEKEHVAMIAANLSIPAPLVGD